MSRALLALLLVASLSACDRNGHDVKGGIEQTRFPGSVTAGGPTSGQVMAAHAPAAAVQPGPAGTPGIPRGAEGNTGGTAMGGTTPSAPAAGATGPTGPASASAAPASAAPGPAGAALAAASAAPLAAASAASAPASAASAPAMTDAQRQQIELAAVMDTVATRWRTRAAAQGWPMNPPTPVAAVGGIQASTAPAAAPAAQPPIRSEKLGTAPPSADVKQPTKPVTDDNVSSRHPTAAGSKP